MGIADGTNGIDAVADDVSRLLEDESAAVVRSGLGTTGGVGSHTIHIYRKVLQVVNVRDGIGTP